MRNDERIYGLRELTRILTLTPERAAQLRRLELLHGDSGYTFRELLALRAARRHLSLQRRLFSSHLWTGGRHGNGDGPEKGAGQGKQLTAHGVSF